MKMAARSHEGLVRVTNEDCVFADAQLGVAILADGMGGLFAGEEASAVAVEAARRQLVDEGVEVASKAAAEEVMRRAHDVLMEYAGTLNFVGKMGTTLLLWVGCGDTSFVAHIGDSRFYQFADQQLVQLSADHTLAQRMVDMGVLPASQVYLSPKRHVLTQGLGLPGVINPQCLEVAPRGRLLMCSDGLSDLVRPPRMAELLAITDIDEAATALIRTALDEGGHDNVSVILIDP